jgi:hypothetical protein
MTVVLMAGSWIWELKQWMQRQQKNTADQYNNRIVALMNSAQEANSLGAPEDIWRDLLAILTETVHDLDADKLSEESFDSCRSILQMAMDVARTPHRFGSHEPRGPRRLLAAGTARSLASAVQNVTFRASTLATRNEGFSWNQRCRRKRCQKTN